MHIINWIHLGLLDVWLTHFLVYLRTLEEFGVFFSIKNCYRKPNDHNKIFVHWFYFLIDSFFLRESRTGRSSSTLSMIKKAATKTS